MRMLNRRGFTLVELLGVIVILSVVVGITIPVSTKVINDSKYKALIDSVDIAEKFVEDQWRIKKMDPATMTEAFKETIKDYRQDDFVRLSANNEQGRILIDEMGIPTAGIKTVFFKIYEDNIPCVVIGELFFDSALYNNKYWQKVSYNGEEIAIPNDKENEGYYSKCCVVSDVQAMLSERYSE